MKFSDIEKKLNECIDKPFKELFNETDLVDVIKNKGKSGQLLEKHCGIENGNSLIDLEDMEVKSFKCGESIAITQVSSHIDDVMNEIDFKDSWVYQKIRTVLFTEVDKSDSKPENWKYRNYKIVSLDENEELLKRLDKEFKNICTQVKDSVANGGQIHTFNGDGINTRASKALIQIRTKDSKPYHPISFAGVQVSSKNYAFYFRNKFVKEVILETIV